MAKPTSLAAAACAVTLATGCSMVEGLIGGGGGGGGTKPSGAPTKPAAAPAQLAPDDKARQIVFTWANTRSVMTRMNATDRLAGVEGGSLLETNIAEMKVLKKAKREMPKISGQASQVMTPKMPGYPKWFIGTTHEERRKDRRQMVVFVAQKPGGGRPVRAVASVDLDRTAFQRIEKTIGKAEFGDVVPPGDTSLAIAPEALAETHAWAVRAPGSPKASLFDAPAATADVAARVSLWRRYFTSAGWKGTSQAVAWQHPTYALRMSNGGALVVYGVDVTHTYGNEGGGRPRMGLVGGRWGNVFLGMIGRSAVRKELRGVERTEFAAYVPPKGKGKITVIGSRWSPVRLQGE